MKNLSIFFLFLLLVILSGCSGGTDEKSVDLGLVDTGQEFNPIKWHGKNRIEMGKLMPEISNINKTASGGPFVLENVMGFKQISFSFENTERDAKLMNLNVEFSEPVTIQEAQQKFGVNISGIAPQKSKRNYWYYALNKPLIHAFNVGLKPEDTDSTKLLRAWITYRLN